MHIDKVNWITAHNCGKPKWHSFSPKFKLKKENFGPRHCLTKCAQETNYWTKIADLGIILLRKNYFIYWYQLLHPHIVGSTCIHTVPFLLGHPVYCQKKGKLMKTMPFANMGRVILVQRNLKLHCQFYMFWQYTCSPEVFANTIFLCTCVKI